MRHSPTPFWEFLARFLEGTSRVSSARGIDLLPIPAVLPTSESDGTLTTVVNMSLAGYNFMYGGLSDVPIPEVANSAQRAAQERVRSKWCMLPRHASATTHFLEGASLASNLRRASSGSTSVPLIASCVNGLARAGCVDPSSCLFLEMQALFDDPSGLFTDALDNVPRVIRYNGGAGKVCFLDAQTARCWQSWLDEVHSLCCTSFCGWQT